MITQRYRGAALCLLALAASSFLGDNETTALLTNPVSVSPIASKTGSSSPVFDGLVNTPLVRASDEELVSLPSLWKSNTPFGLGDETAVCAFLRHYG